MDINEKLVLINKNTLESLEETETLKIVERFTATGIEVLSADFGFMFWKLKNDNKYKLIYTSPQTPYVPKLPRKNGYNHKAAVGRTPYFVTNPVSFVLPYMKSLAIIPIFYKNHQYGSIVLCFKTKRIFTKEEGPLMVTFSNSAAQVLTIHRNQKKAEKISIKLLRQKDEFFDIVSHELKTPVTTIKGFSQILNNKLQKNDSEAKYFLDKINSQVDKLSHLINDLLFVSRIETGKISVQIENFDLQKLVRHVVEGLKVAIKDHPISFKSTHQICVRGDTQRIEGVIINLINNAAKYSPPGSKIKVSLKEKNKRAYIEVEDFGYGIPDKDKVKIFSRFFRSKNSNKRDLPGLGLGLYIASSIVKRHGGNLSCKNKKNTEGTIFYFDLPYYKCRVNNSNL